MPIVTIARGSLWGGQAVAERIAKALDCPCIGRETLMSEALNLSSTVGSGGPGAPRPPELWDRVASDRSSYLAALQVTLARHAATGNLVYHGLGGHLLLRDVPAVLRVRIIAPLETRIEIVARNEGIGREEAEAYLRKVDEEWARWIKFIFDVDWHDPSLYDLVINLERLTVEGACSAVLEATRRPEFQATEAVTNAVRDLALASKVRLVLSLVQSTMAIDLEVTAKDGRVTLKGLRSAEKPLSDALNRTERFLKAIVEQTEGVQDVAVELGP